MVLSGGCQVSLPACMVNPSADFSVVLPVVSTRALAVAGATAGRTPFHLSLGCPANATLAVSMQSSRPSAAVIGLSEPQAGGAHLGSGAAAIELLRPALSAGRYGGSGPCQCLGDLCADVFVAYWLEADREVMSCRTGGLGDQCPDADRWLQKRLSRERLFNPFYRSLAN